jgi:type IV secretory pathway VirJ component
MKRILPVLVLLLALGGAAFVATRPDTYNQSHQIARLFGADPFFRKDNLSDLPLLEFPAKTHPNDYLVILFAGDGGWKGLVDVLAKRFSARGTPVVGFNSADYFNVTRSPADIAHVVERISHNFGHAWGRKKIILMGYSFSAEVLPFAYNASPPAVRPYLARVVMLAPSNWADFKSSPLYYYSPKTSLQVLPELRKMPPDKLLILCDHTKYSICQALPPHQTLPVVRLDTDHNFNGKYTWLAGLLARKLGL